MEDSEKDYSEVDKRWNQLVKKTKENGETSLGMCQVTLMMEGESASILISDDFGTPFELVLPQTELSTEAKASLLLLNAGGDKSAEGIEDVTVAYKSLLISDFENIIIPNASDGLKKDLESVETSHLVIAIMTYMELMLEAMVNHEVADLVIAPDGAFYIKEDIVPFTPGEIVISIMEDTGTSVEIAANIIKILPKLAMEFAAIFPGMESKKEGYSAKINCYDMDCSEDFAASITNLLMSGRGVSFEIMGLDPIELFNMEDFKNLGSISIPEEQKDMYRQVIDSTPIAQLMDFFREKKYSQNDIDMISCILLYIYFAAGNIVEHDDIANYFNLSDAAQEFVFENITFLIDSNRKDKSFCFTWGPEGFMYFLEDGEDEV